MYLFNTHFYFSFQNRRQNCFQERTNDYTLRVSVHTWSLAFIFFTDLYAVISLHTHVFINSAFLPFMNKLCLANFHTSLVAFSWALNQSLGKFYVHSTTVYRYIQKHLTSLKLLKILLGGNYDRCICGQVTLALLGGRMACQTFCPLLLQSLLPQCWFRGFAQDRNN